MTLVALRFCATQHHPLGMFSVVPACLILVVTSVVSGMHCLGMGARLRLANCHSLDHCSISAPLQTLYCASLERTGGLSCQRLLSKSHCPPPINTTLWATHGIVIATSCFHPIIQLERLVGVGRREEEEGLDQKHVVASGLLHGQISRKMDSLQRI